MPVPVDYLPVLANKLIVINLGITIIDHKAGEAMDHLWTKLKN